MPHFNIFLFTGTDQVICPSLIWEAWIIVIFRKVQTGLFLDLGVSIICVSFYNALHCTFCKTKQKTYPLQKCQVFTDTSESKNKVSQSVTLWYTVHPSKNLVTFKNGVCLFGPTSNSCPASAFLLPPF